ncbi:hypothetical protein AKJ16_DCAP23551, partial [Drosera capensis]
STINHVRIPHLSPANSVTLSHQFTGAGDDDSHISFSEISHFDGAIELFTSILEDSHWAP